MAPDALAGFEILGEIGRGSRTVVYRVAGHGGEYAMKVVQPPAGLEASELEFRREAALLSCVDHPGVGRVHEVGTVDGRPYLVMDLVRGQRLGRLAARGPVPVRRIIQIAIDVADALGAAHRVNVVHRDVKPDNIVIGTDGRARLVDFGLAMGPGQPDHPEAAGTLQYSAPEQAGMLNRPVDGRADLYALGAVLFEAATGAPPFVSADVGSLLRMHASAPVPDPRQHRPELPAVFALIVQRLLAKDPDDRYQSADGLIADLRRLAADLDEDGAHPPREGAPFPLGRSDVPVGWQRERPLVGRARELAALAERWQQARAGAGGVAIIEGTPGAGKSRLARALLESLAADRAGPAVVLAGKAEEDESAPLAPLRRAVDAYLEAVRRLPAPQRDPALTRLRRAAGPAGSLLRALSPSLGDLVGAPAWAGTEAHQQFPALVAGFLITLARLAGGAVVLIDDVQWADEPTRQVLRRLAAAAPGTPLLLLGAVRTAGGGEATPPPDPPADLTVRLGPLPPAAIADLIAEALGGLRLQPAAAADLAARSGGNPFTALQYVGAMMIDGLIRPCWGTWIVDGERLAEMRLPGDVTSLVLSRLEGLDPGSRRLLGFGAVVGSVFDAGLVGEAVGVATPLVVSVADIAAWRHLVQRVDAGYAFVHDRIREALLAQFDAAALRAAHDRVADVLAKRLAARPATGRDAVYALAQHCLLGNLAANPDRVYRACAAAGRMALADQAPAEALSYLTRAAEAARAAGLAPDTDLLLSLGLAQHRTGRFHDAVETLRRSRERCDDPLRRAAILAAIARVHDSTWTTDQQLAVIDEALQELRRAPSRQPVVLALTSAGYLVASALIRLTRLGYGGARGRARELDRLLAVLYEAATLANTRHLQPWTCAAFAARERYVASRLGPGIELARMDMAEAFLINTLGLRRLAGRRARRAAAAAERLNDPQTIAHVAWLEGYRRQAFAEDQGERIRAVLADHAQWLDAGSALDLVHTLCWDALLRGDRAVLTDVFRRRDALVAASDRTSRVSHHGSVAGLLALRGHAEEARTHLAELRELYGPHPLPWESVDLFYATAVVALELDDLGPAFDAAAAAFDALGYEPFRLIQAELGLYLTVAYARLEQCRAAAPPERAYRLHQARQAVAVASRAARSVVHRAHGRVLEASLLQVTGADDAALRALDRSEPVLRRADAPLVAFKAAVVRARALRALRVPGEADRQLEYALTVAAAHDWPLRAARLAAEFGRASSPPVPELASESRDPGNQIALGLFRQRLQAIEQIGQAASRVLDPDRLVAIVLDEIVRILGPERAFLFLVEGDPPRLTPHGGRDADGRDIRELTGYSATLVERVRSTQRPLVVTGTEEGAALGAQSAVMHGLRSIMVAPLRAERRLLGVIYLDSRVAQGIFTEDDVGLLGAMCTTIAVALETARAARLEVAVTAATEQREVAEALRAALADMSAILEPDEVLGRLLNAARTLTGSARAWLVLGRPGQDKASVRAAGGDESPVDVRGALRELLDTASVLVRADPSGLPDPLEPAPGVTWMAVPLSTRDERLGIVLLAAPPGRTFSAGTQELAAALASQGAIAYENARLFVEIHRLATVDSLTGLATRGHFFDEAHRTMNRVRHAHRPLTAMMVDIDHFKDVNDRFGHQVGDEVIQTVAARLQRQGRRPDLMGRYGGEEFAILQTARLDNATRSAERLRAAIADRPVATSAGPVRVTISVGVSDARPDDTDVGALLARADRQLYEAKRAGRNRVVAG